jgi:uncharacterized protein (DUF1697 family)
MKRAADKKTRIYVALIRAVNVGGHSAVKMHEVRKRFEALGLKDVASHIQSGNVIFSTRGAEPRLLTRQIESELSALTGREITAFVFFPGDLRKAAAANPFDPARRDKQQRCHLMFLSAAPAAARPKALMAMQGMEHRFYMSGKVLYFAYSRKCDGNRRSIDFEKVLGVSGTARSWNVLDKLIEIAGRLEDH